MAGDSTARDMQSKPQGLHRIVLSNDDLEVTDDNFDVDNDDNVNHIIDNSDVDDDYLDELDGFGLKDLDPDSFALLTSVMNDRDFSPCPVSDDGDVDGAKERDVSEGMFPSGSQVNQSMEDTGIENDEENAILKEIREEIERKVRNEMKDELNGYHRRIKAIENGFTSGTTFENGLETEVENLEDMDPKLREAMMKMRKLDKILFEKMQIEKEVKRNRILLEKRMRREIAEMTKGVNIPQDIKINTDKFLALEPPASHNEGITVDDETDLPPVFQTQLEESEALWRKSDGKVQTAKEEIKADGSARAESLLRTSSRSAKSQTKPETKSTRHKKDFIKRNKELASNTDQSTSMTDDEKKRLAELLEGLDDLSGPEDGASDAATSQLNAYQATLQQGEGYSLDCADRKNLSNIDDQLKILMPKEDYLSLLSPRPVPQPPLFSRVGMHTSATVTDASERFGERALLETKDERELKVRLQAIEQELAKFKARPEEESDGENHLTNEQLDRLLDQCARNLAVPLSPESPDLSARSVASSRLSLMENPPKLTDEQLERLLSEAHFPLSSRLLTLREDDEKPLEGERLNDLNFADNIALLYHTQNEMQDKLITLDVRSQQLEESSTETIKAETWKVIKDVNLNEPDYLDQQFPDLADIDRELQSFIDKANINMNTSNNHNRNIATKNDTKNRHQHDEPGSGEFVPISSPSAFSTYHLIQSSTYSGSAAGGLPRISQSNGISRSEIAVDNRSCPETPIYLSRDNSDDMIRLPDISTKSFLVHAYQGMNSDKDRSNLPTKQSVDLMCNDLFEMRLDDISDDRDKEKEQSNGCKSSSRNMIQPKPPLPKDWQ